jgi:hypothetical protein
VIFTAFAWSRAVTEPIERDAIHRRRRFPRDVIETRVRWYLTYRLSISGPCRVKAQHRGELKTSREVVRQGRSGGFGVGSGEHRQVVAAGIHDR